MNTNYSLLETTIPQFGREADPFRVAEEQRRWWIWIEPFLKPLVENQMLINKPALKDAPVLEMLVTDAVQSSSYSNVRLFRLNHFS